MSDLRLPALRFVTMSNLDTVNDAEDRYRETVARRQMIEAMWNESGKPLLSSGSTGQLMEHPLVKMMREHDSLLVKLAAEVSKRHRGPQPSAVPSIRKPSSSKLRAVENG